MRESTIPISKQVDLV